jgi:hypothetical protein
VPRSQDAPLSPHEEITLRRVALGITDARYLSHSDLHRLKRLLLVIDVQGHPELTLLGRKRYYALPNAMEISDVARSHVVVALENYIRKHRLH